jgi:hypothetical protein
MQCYLRTLGKGWSGGTHHIIVHAGTALITNTNNPLVAIVTNCGVNSADIGSVLCESLLGLYSSGVSI